MVVPTGRNTPHLNTRHSPQACSRLPLAPSSPITQVWDQTGRILEELKRAELRKMTEAEAAKIFTELDYPCPPRGARSPSPRTMALSSSSVGS